MSNTETQTADPIPKYGSPRTAGDRYLTHLYDGPTVVQEKIDGSNFSFMYDETSGKVLFRSRNRMLDPTEPNGQFQAAIDHILDNKDSVQTDYIYRGEVVSSKRHNKLTYADPAGVPYDHDTD